MLENNDFNKIQVSFFDKLKHSGKSDNTLKNYKTDLDCFDQFLSHKNNTKKFSDIDLPLIKHYGEYLQKKYTSDNSRRRRVQSLRVFFDYLVENGFFSSNLVREIPTSPKFLDIPRPSSFKDVQELWSYLDRSKKSDDELLKLVALRNQIIFLLIYTAGIKVSDLSKLKLKHILLNKDPRVMITHPKKDPYTIPLHQKIIEVCGEYFPLLEKHKLKYQLEFNEVLFNANAHRIIKGGLSPRGLELIFKQFSNNLKIEITPKSLRQSCIFNWIHSDHGQQNIKEWLGVAPSYSMKLYLDHKDNHIFSTNFLTLKDQSNA